MRKSGRFSFGRFASGRFTKTNTVAAGSPNPLPWASVTAKGPSQAFVSLSVAEPGGTVYTYVSDLADPPNNANWQTGTGAAFHSKTQVTTTSSQSPGPSGLTPGTRYFVHLRYVQTNGQVGTQTLPVTMPDVATAVPLASTATLTVINNTALSLAVENIGASGVLFWVATTDAASPLADDIRTGMGAAASGRMTLSPLGPDQNTAMVTDLIGVPHWLHFLHQDAATDSASMFSEGPVTPHDTTAPVITSFEKTSQNSGHADFAFNTDTGEGRVRIIALQAGAAVPTPMQVLAGTDAADQPATNVMVNIAQAGHKLAQLAGLPADQSRDFYVAQQDAVGNVSGIQEDRVPTAQASPFLWTEWSDGKATGDHLGGLTVTDGFPDHNGQPNAILVSNDGKGNTQMIKFTDHHHPIHANAPTWISLKAQAVAHTSKKAWLRFHTIDFGFSQYGWVDITNDETALKDRVGVITKGISNVSVTQAGGGYFEIRIEFDATKLRISNGRILFRYTSQNRKLAIQSNTSAGAFQLALTDIKAGAT